MGISMTHEERANTLLRQGYHCSQAMFGAYAEELGLDLKTAMKISTCFGMGMRQGDMCGCVTASMLILGMAFGFYDPQDQEQEIFGNKKTDEFIRKFQEKMDGALQCREILGLDISNPEELARFRQEGMKFKICPRALHSSVEILDHMMGEYQDLLADVGGELSELPIEDELQSAFRRVNRFNRFRRDVRSLIHETEEKIDFIQFDIRKFKVINDIYGEKFGDEILDFITEKVREICNEKQYFVNLRSDVFMIVTERKSEEETLALIERLKIELREFKHVTLQYTFGVYTVEDKSMELRQMEDRAAMARKAAKENIITNVAFYQEQFKELLYNRRFIEDNMQAAITERQFQMYLQPKYSISSGHIVGAEALVRWTHPKRGMIFPNEFIPIIEENGFIRHVDYYIWGEACRFVKRCEMSGIGSCPISVNVSRHHLLGDEFIRVLEDLIKETGINKKNLELEITETVNGQQISEMSNRLKEEGFTLLMDDFGSGYSSLNILLETPFDVIKIDKKFMDNMMVSDKGRLILAYVVSMADKLGLGLLAEGVETKEQVELLQKIGCDIVQGYYYARPMPAEEFYELLEKDREKA